MPDLPAGTVTLAFTDIEGSSRLWEQYSKAFQPALEEHNRLLREAAWQWNGTEVNSWGDALFLAFREASDAVQFAVQGQTALADNDWSALLPGIDDIRVRMGLHTGKPIRNPSGTSDYIGPAVNRAARVGAAAHGGQIVVTGDTFELARSSVPPHITFRDLSAHRLKGVGVVRCWQVCDQRLPQDFPRLRTGIGRRLPIPKPVSSFAPDCYARTQRGIIMPARFLRMDDEGCPVVSSPTGKEYTFDADQLLTVEEAEALLRQNRVSRVADRYQFEILHQDRRSTVIHCWDPRHPVRSNYTVTIAGRREVCSCLSFLKFGGPCKHLEAYHLRQQPPKPPPQK